METLFRFMERLLNTLRTNGLFILLSIAFPVLLYNFGAGGEIIWDLADNDRNYSNFFVACSFIFLSISIWCIPTFSIDIYCWLTRIPSRYKIKILDAILNVYNAHEPRTVKEFEIAGEDYFQPVKNDAAAAPSTTVSPKDQKLIRKSEIPVRYLAVLPWLIYVLTITNVLFSKVAMLLVLVLIIIVILIIDLRIKKIKTIYDITFLHLRWWWEIICILLTGVLLFLMFLVLKVKFSADIGIQNNFIGYVLVITNLTGAFLMYLLLLVKENSEDFPSDRPDKTIMILRKTRYVHISALLISILTMAAYYVMQQKSTLYLISPITVGTMVVSFFILIIEFLFTSQLLISRILKAGLHDFRIRHTIYRFANGALALAMIGTAFRSCNPQSFREGSFSEDIKHLSQECKSEQQVTQRENFEEYFENWYETRKKEGEPVPLYLVSGQGGGSRGGAWFLMNMIQLDKENPDFYNNLFSISTVSGSSSGALMYLAGRKFKGDLIKKTGSAFPKSIYRKNYLSSALFGMMLGDYIDCIMPAKMAHDRNYYFQEEEANAFADALLPKGKPEEKAQLKRFFSDDYMAQYNCSAKYKTPLFMINSTVVENGKKVVFSPVNLNAPISTDPKLAGAPLTFFEDAYGNFRSCEFSRNKTLPLSACVNASQSFPLINAYSYLHGVGRLADGGLFENSGTSTTLEIYQALKKLLELERHNKKKVKITIITILNGKIDDENAVNYKRASILNTLTAVANNPFTGHELMAYNQLQKQKNLLDSSNVDRIFTIHLRKSYSLSRILSGRTLDSISSNLHYLSRQDSYKLR